MIKQVIVVRKDLNMRKGKMCAQVAHASMKVFFDRILQQNDNNSVIISDLTDNMLDWINGAFTKIVVGCDSLEDIHSVKNQCINYNISYAIIEDSGATEFNGAKTITCIAVGPDVADKIDLVTGKYKLL